MFEKGLQGKRHLLPKPLLSERIGDVLPFTSRMRMSQSAGSKPPAAAEL